MQRPWDGLLYPNGKPIHALEIVPWSEESNGLAIIFIVVFNWRPRPLEFC